MKREARSPKGKHTADQILEASAHCVAEIGIERTSITAIAKRAKVSRSLVAHYFPVKAKLFSQVIAHISARAQSTIHGAEVSHLPPGEQLALLFRRNFEFFGDNASYARCYLLFYYYCGVDPELLRQNAAMVEQAEARIAQLLAAMGLPAPAALARELHNQLLGTLIKQVSAKKGGAAEFSRWLQWRLGQAG